ncbi:molecular chaperone [Photorhabdus akhurstii]|uniref:fimbrial biogenesis chaperone n=1 Tax=Photorhabdus akhurstii TaxID=171438 RepID=UPI001FE43472|nr:molecular chaperone [Photorhabdus akhurstii]
MRKLIVIGMLGIWAVVASSSAHAGLMLRKTRIIYQQGDKVQSISLQNSGEEVYLVQAAVTPWDNSNTRSSEFTVLPPLFRMEGNSLNVMRLVRTGGDFPADRESLFRFRINAIPAKKTTDESKENSNGKQDEIGASLSISLGMNIKLIYRPDKLPMTPEQARGRLTFTQSGNSVVVTNPTPYYQTFAQLKLDGKAVDFDKAPSILTPFGQTTLPLAGKVGGKVEWSMITDIGGVSKLQSGTLQAG